MGLHNYIRRGWGYTGICGPCVWLFSGKQIFFPNLVQTNEPILIKVCCRRTDGLTDGLTG